MMQNLITAEITGADIPETMQCLINGDITLLCIVPKDELTVQLTFQRCYFRKLWKICQRRGDKIRILSRQGLYWNVRAFLQRPVLMVGFLIILFLTLYLPSRILFVKVEGNSLIPDRQILDMADSCGIGFGASRRGVRSEKMKNALLEAIPQLQWAGINTKGCVAVITVREREVPRRNMAEEGLCHIVALTDARITDCTATRGTLLCAPGQAVRAGQILISGYTDTGLTLRAHRAEGEVYGQTRRSFRAVTPGISAAVMKTGGQMKKISLLIGKKRINLWKDSGIWDATCDRMYEEYYITLPGGFRLPLALAVERFVVLETAEREIPQEKAETLLMEFAESSLIQSMVAGSIDSCDVSVMPEPGIWILTGEYRCTELVGICKRLQIGE